MHIGIVSYIAIKPPFNNFSKQIYPDSIFKHMDSHERSAIRTGNGTDLAFAVVVLMAYFVTFSSLHSASRLEILAMISLGISYIAMGIYGYAYCSRADEKWYSISYFVVQIILGGCIVYLSKGAGLHLLILLPLTGHSVVLLSSIWVYLVNFLILGVYAVALQTATGSWDFVAANVPYFLAGQVFIVAFVQMAVNEERARKEVEQLVKNLSEANDQLREYADQIEALTLTQERARMAREIHDGLGHYLTTINMQLQAAMAIIQKDKKNALVTLANAQMLTKEALAEVRRSVLELRETIEYSESVVEKIRRLAENSNLLNIVSKFEVIGETRHLRPAVELALYRAAQEGISNIYKHAGATKVWVTLDFTDLETVFMEIRDNGIGSVHLDEGFGLRGLQERVGLLNGRIKTETTLGSGFVLNVLIPG